MVLSPGGERSGGSFAGSVSGTAGRIRGGVNAAGWVAGGIPLFWLLAAFLQGDLGANPIESLLQWTGLLALGFLLLSLAVTPIRRLTGWNAIVRLRRTLGLVAFGWAALHFTVWAGLDLNLQFAWIREAIAERPFITVGFAAFLILSALAVTSTRGWIRRLGRRWTLLHRGAYAAAGMGVLHFAWALKADLRLPFAAAALLALLLLLRVFPRRCDPA